MNKQILILFLVMQSVLAMEQQKKQVLRDYRIKRDSLFCGMSFFNKDDSEEVKETYFAKLKESYHLYKQEACIGCALCTAASAIACCAIPFAYDSQFCYEYPAGWLCCCIIKCGAIGVDAAISEKVISYCCDYWKTRNALNQVAAVRQLRPVGEKIKKVE